MDIPSLNAHLRKVLDEKFMLEFIEIAKEGLIYSHRRSLSKQKEALEVIARLKPIFEKAELDHAEVIAAAKEIASAVEDAIDRLEIIKDNSAYTFRTSLREAIRQYYDGIERNKKEETRYARQMASYERKVARGKTPDYVVADKKLVDLDKAAKDIVSVLVRIEEDFKRRLAIGENVDFDERTVAMVDYLKQKASDVAYKVSRAMENGAGCEAWEVAEDIMEQVRKKDPGMYDELIMKMEQLAYRIPKDEAERIVRNMRPKGQYWSLQQIRDYLKGKGITENCVNWYMVMNMVYNDFYETAKTYGLHNDVEFFYSLAKDFIDDPDAKPMKVEKYFSD